LSATVSDGCVRAVESGAFAPLRRNAVRRKSTRHVRYMRRRCGGDATFRAPQGNAARTLRAPLLRSISYCAFIRARVLGVYPISRGGYRLNVLTSLRSLASLRRDDNGRSPIVDDGWLRSAIGRKRPIVAAFAARPDGRYERAMSAKRVGRFARRGVSRHVRYARLGYCGSYVSRAMMYRGTYVSRAASHVPRVHNSSFFILNS
jgi:hypothetical protein